MLPSSIHSNESTDRVLNPLQPAWYTTSTIRASKILYCVFKTLLKISVLSLLNYRDLVKKDGKVGMEVDNYTIQ